MGYYAPKSISLLYRYSIVDMTESVSNTRTVEATSTKFLAAVEDVITKPTTTPVVKARVLEVLSGAAHAYPGQAHSNGPLGAFARDKSGGYGALWKKVKPAGYPDDVITPLTRFVLI